MGGRVNDVERVGTLDRHRTRRTLVELSIALPGDLRVPTPNRRRVLRNAERTRERARTPEVDDRNHADVVVHRCQQLPQRHGDRSRLFGAVRRGLSPHDAEPRRSSRARGVRRQVELRESADERRVRRRVRWRCQNLHAHAPNVGGGLAFDSYGGAINRVASDTTAFVHRDALACIQATYSWSSYTSPSEIAAGAQWLRWLGTNVFDPTTGAYQNYIDPTLTNWPSAYYGTNLARLVEIKNRYDPDNLFSFAQSIPLSL